MAADDTVIADLLTRAAGAYRDGRLDDAAALYHAADEMAPDDFRIPYSLAIIDLRQGRLADACTRLRRVLLAEPEHFAAWHNLGAASQALARWDDAAFAFTQAYALRPDAVESGFGLASVLTILGRADEAASLYGALAMIPAQRLRALPRLAILAPAAIDDSQLADLTNAAADPRMALDRRAEAAFAVGESLDARGGDAAAFAAFDYANRLKRQSLLQGPEAHHPERVQDDYDRLATALKAARWRGPPGEAGVAPIFVVGMPRSGSTLVEQILASHPQVQGLGETALLSQVVAQQDGETSVADLRSAYLDGLRALGWDGVRRPADKTLENHLYVGLIRLMFPDAVILHTVRDPVETCVACFRQLFASGNETLYDLGDTARAYQAYRGQMDHWRQLLPGAVADVAYEALVDEPESQIRRLVTQLAGLPWDAACLAFHANQRPVHSASAAQVRRPIFRQRPYRERYAGKLDTLITALGPLAEP